MEKITKDTEVSLTLMGDNGETNLRKVGYSTKRLSYGKKQELATKCNMMNFSEIDMTSLREGEVPGLQNFKSFDLKAMLASRTLVEVELTQLLWGITDLDINNIIAEDFEKILEFTISQDVLGIEKEAEEAKKKKAQELAEV